MNNVLSKGQKIFCTLYQGPTLEYAQSLKRQLDIKSKNNILMPLSELGNGLSIHIIDVVLEETKYICAIEYTVQLEGELV